MKVLYVIHSFETATGEAGVKNGNFRTTRRRKMQKGEDKEAGRRRRKEGAEKGRQCRRNLVFLISLFFYFVKKSSVNAADPSFF